MTDSVGLPAKELADNIAEQNFKYHRKEGKPIYL